MNLQDAYNKLNTLNENDEQYLILLQNIEQAFENVIKSQPSNINFLLKRNEFRVKYAQKMSIRRPRILVGEINNDVYPNFHTIELLLVADIVSISSVNHMCDRIDRINYNNLREGMPEIISRLPEGYKPDFF
ncbi:hypothetical protein KFE96_05750 [Kordiimonas sp. SCSIO 12603]|uniref:hypothetical protein n=1 Tax=Kordiimonas sp. SCSIO 12603 TaxID=2829596 RepID=UPI002102C788|nr:hypothetical protein [Kordiimonas sp. SCSIO 12603]UTW59807.1 hypothetical protein KFE96_05750 [Kordiimonas sp. SCSIO 12603]